MKLRLSDAFEHEIKTGDFEWTALMIDINYGANKELMDKCQALKHYSIFVYKVKKYNMEYKDLTKAIDRAVDECISEGILAEFLSKMKSEVRNVLLEEYDEERAIKSWNYAMDKMQNEIKQYQKEIEQCHDKIQQYDNKIQQYDDEKRENIIQTVSLLRELEKDEDFIEQTLINKYNISKEDLKLYM